MGKDPVFLGAGGVHVTHAVQYTGTHLVLDVYRTCGMVLIDKIEYDMMRWDNKLINVYGAGVENGWISLKLFLSEKGRRGEERVQS